MEHVVGILAKGILAKDKFLLKRDVFSSSVHLCFQISDTSIGQGTGLTAAERRVAKALNRLIADTNFAAVQALTARELRARRRDELRSGGTDAEKVPHPRD